MVGTRPTSSTDTLGVAAHRRSRRLGRRPEDLHPARSAFATARVASANARYTGSTSGARSAMAARCASTVAQSPRAMGPVSSKPFSITTPHERDECLGRSAALGEPRGNPVQGDQEVRGHRRPGVVQRLVLVRQFEGVHAKPVGKPAGHRSRLGGFERSMRPCVQLLRAAGW